MIDLFRSNNVVVRSVPAEDVSRWVVTFDHYGIGPGFDRPGFGEDFLRQSGVSAIHVMGRREDWYQYPEMAEAMAAVRRATAQADRVMTYGTSMGAYAALRFADAAGANTALAISPQYSIDPAKVPFETRWLQDSHRIQWLPEIDGLLVCGCRPVIVFDPAGEDGPHIRRIEAEINIVPVDIRYSKHPSTTYLLETGLLKSLVFDVLSGAFDAGAFKKEAGERRRHSSTYLSRLAELQPPRRHKTGMALARRACEIAPNDPIALGVLGRYCGDAGDHEQAVALHERATEVSQRAANCLVSHGNALVAAGRLEEALALADEVIEQLPEQAHLRAWRSLILWQLGSVDPAINAIEEAIALDPHQPRYLHTLERYRERDERTGGDGAFGRLLRFVRRSARTTRASGPARLLRSAR
ncbi:tetratricopeptide repeat protein [Brevundimonas sp.]|uniref:tetratricopeptide repeat protein n=1 Tax=Brevundimonas sp. TaxID=1871086 RepID=UPI00289A38FA|nr:tetratricopeptide repeat protein [Brevundimonas sp.]